MESEDKEMPFQPSYVEEPVAQSRVSNQSSDSHLGDVVSDFNETDYQSKCIYER